MDSEYELATSPKAEAAAPSTTSSSSAAADSAPPPVSTEGNYVPPAVAGAASPISSTEIVATAATADRTKAAQAAFESKDPAASREVHTQQKMNVELHGGQANDFVKSLIFGGLGEWQSGVSGSQPRRIGAASLAKSAAPPVLITTRSCVLIGPSDLLHRLACSLIIRHFSADGVVTTLATIASAFGANMSVESIILLSVSNLIAEAISMGLGDGISSKAEYDFLQAERAREEWEFENHPEGEKEEMVDLLKQKGFEDKDATRIIDIVAQPQHKSFFVDYMMVEELSLEVPDDPWGPLKEGVVTFLSFMAFGGIPVLVYVFSYVGKYENQGAIFGISCAFTVVALFLLGTMQARISKLPMLKNGVLIALNGTIAAAAAYGVGYGLMKAVCKS